MRVVRWTALFLRPKRGSPFDSPLRGGWGLQRHWRCMNSAALCAAARERGYSLSEENTPFESPRERRGASPSTPDIAGFGLEGLHALRSVGAVYVASPRVPAFRYIYQPRALRSARVTFARRRTAVRAAALLRSPLLGGIAALLRSPRSSKKKTTALAVVFTIVEDFSAHSQCTG